MEDYDNYRINLLAKAILQLNEKAGYVIDDALLNRLEDNFQYQFDEDYEERDLNGYDN